MFCTKCGKEISDGAKFCTSCGNPVAGQRVVPKKEVFQTATLIDLTTMSKQIHFYYVIAAVVCVAIVGIASYKWNYGWYFAIWAIIQGMLLPLALIFAKKKHYENFGIISFVVVICQLILALIAVYHYHNYQEFFQEFGEPFWGTPEHDEYISLLKKCEHYFNAPFNSARLFIYWIAIDIDRSLSYFFQDLFSIIANCICGIAFLHLSKFPDEEVESENKNENTEVHENE